MTFTLHQSFKNPVREVFQPPYEVTEAGWGEFDVGVAVSARRGSPDQHNRAHNRMYCMYLNEQPPCALLEATAFPQGEVFRGAEPCSPRSLAD